jgi:hypothetical protein
MLPVPNAIVLALALLLLNIPVVKVKPFKFNVPLVSTVVLLAPDVNAD